MSASLPISSSYNPASVHNFIAVSKCSQTVNIISGIVGTIFIMLTLSGMFGALKSIGSIVAIAGGGALFTISALNIIMWLVISKCSQQSDSQEKVKRERSEGQPDTNGLYDIHRLVVAQDLKKMKQLLESGASVDKRNAQSQTALHQAVLIGSKEMVELLIRYKADVNAVDEVGCTPVILAIRHGKLEILQLLLSAGAKGTCRIAAHLKELLKPNKFGRTALHWMIKWDDTKALSELIDAGVDINQTDSNGHTALHLASMGCKEESVGILIKNSKIDVNKQDNQGHSALYWAAKNNNTKIMAILIDSAKANVNMQDNEQNTPLHIASQCSSLEIINMLLEHGADVTRLNNEQRTAFHILAQGGKEQAINACIQHLISEGEEILKREINRQDKDGYTPLHLAAMRGEDGIITLLLDNGADRAIRDNSENTPLDYAKDKPSRALLEKQE